MNKVNNKILKCMFQWLGAEEQIKIFISYKFKFLAWYELFLKYITPMATDLPSEWKKVVWWPNHHHDSAY